MMAVHHKVETMLRWGWPIIPLCWPTPNGQCACGKGHTGRNIGKAPLVWGFGEGNRPSRKDCAISFAVYPCANVGLLLSPLKWLVIDADSDEALAEIEERGVRPGLRTRRGSRVRHVVTRRPDNSPIGCVAKKGTSGCLDVLADGYVVVPPSRHLEGTVYEWDGTLGVDIPLAPAWAVQFLRDSQSRRGQAVGIPEDIEPVDVSRLAVSDSIKRIILYGPDPARHASRSEAVYAALMAMVRARCSDKVIFGVMLNPHHQLAQKPLERGLTWLAGEIGGARADFAAQSCDTRHVSPSGGKTQWGRG